MRASALLTALVAQGDTRVVVRDEDGDVHFNGGFRNAKSVRRALADLAQEDAWAEPVAADGDAVAALFEEVFDHASFTGRSGTFFANEGLGSIYWHMVSKLLLAVQESYHRAQEASEPPARVAGQPTTTSVQAWGSTRLPMCSAPSRPIRTHTRRPTPARSSPA